MKNNGIKKFLVVAALLLFSASCNDPYSNLNNNNGNGDKDDGGTLHPGGGGWSPSNPDYFKKIINYKNLSKAIGFYDFDHNDNVREIRNDLVGSLTGMVQFAQSHTINPNGNADNFLPMLVAERNALLLFTLTKDIAPSVNYVTAEIILNGKLKSLSMNEPGFIPRSDSTQPSKPEVLYSRKAWSVELPWDWVNQGMEIRFITDDGKEGVLLAEDIDVGPPSEAVFTFLRLGMLTDFRKSGSGHMMDTPGRTMADYFQTVPIAKAINVTYENRSLDRVIVFDGTIYDLNSPDPSLRHSKDTVLDVYSGDMRAAVAKSQVSIGINMANYGVPSNNMGQSYNHYFYIMTTHLAQGLYANGVRSHGLSGGNGIGTLSNTTGNEFSHEVGHSYGFGHFQQPQGLPVWWQGGHAESGWGYSSYKKRMHSNLVWGSNGSQGNTPEVNFKGLYNYSRDTMSGGWGESAISLYTHLTGYSAMRGQNFFINKPVLSEESSTGYLKWNSATKKMEEFTQPSQNKFKPLKPYKIGVPVITILGGYYPTDFETNKRAVMMPYFRGNWGNVFNHEKPDLTKKACWLEIDFQNGTKDRIKVAENLYDTKPNNPAPNQFHVNIEEARKPTSASLFCQNQGGRPVLMDTPTRIPTDLEPMKPAVIIGKEYGYTQATQEEIVLLEKNLEKYKNEEIPILDTSETETLVWLYDNISEMNETSQAVANKYLGDLAQSKTIEKFIDENYEALQKGDLTAGASLQQIYSKSGFGEITEPFSKTGVLKVQDQCVTLVENGNGLFNVKFAKCVEGNKNQGWFLDVLNRVRSSVNSRMCLQASTANYTPLAVKTCENIPVQTWIFEEVANDKYLMRMKASTGRCLVRQTNGNQIVTWVCGNNATQFWILPPKDNRKSLVFLSNENYDIVYDLFKN